MICKIKRNFNINNSDDINSPEFWNSRVYLTLDVKAEHEKLQDIYN